MRKYKSYQPMRGWTNVTMAKTFNRGLIFLTILALVSALPLMGQKPTATDRVAGGPVAALFDAPSAASERTAPDMAAVPFTPGRVDTTQHLTDIEMFEWLKPVADGFKAAQLGLVVHEDEVGIDKGRVGKGVVEFFAAQRTGAHNGNFLLIGHPVGPCEAGSGFLAGGWWRRHE